MPKIPTPKSLPIEGRKLAYAFDTKNYPGKVEVRYVTFTTEIIPMDQFEDKTFQLVDTRDPRIKGFLESQSGK